MQVLLQVSRGGRGQACVADGTGRERVHTVSFNTSCPDSKYRSWQRLPGCLLAMLMVLLDIGRWIIRLLVQIGTRRWSQSTVQVYTSRRITILWCYQGVAFTLTVSVPEAPSWINVSEVTNNSFLVTWQVSEWETRCVSKAIYNILGIFSPRLKSGRYRSIFYFHAFSYLLFSSKKT